MRPAPPDTGVVFVRTDRDPPVRIPVAIDAVKSEMRRTVLHASGVSVETVEHCLAAVHALRIDNLEIEIDAGELPNIDGSCLPYTDLLTEAGAVTQDQPRQPFIIKSPVEARDGDQLIYALPGDEDSLGITYHLDYRAADAPTIGRQLCSYDITPQTFIAELAPARTFVTAAEAERFRAAGLGAHLTTRDILVFGPEGPIDNPLRFPDECVRHKVADLLGDLMLLGTNVRGRIVAYRSGHKCNQLLVRNLAKQIEKEQRRRKLGTDALLDIRKIQKILPHRYPFLLVDRVIEIDGHHRAVGLKNVTMNEQFFQGHYPSSPIMPGVLIVEAPGPDVRPALRPALGAHRPTRRLAQHG